MPRTSGKSSTTQIVLREDFGLTKTSFPRSRSISKRPISCTTISRRNRRKPNASSPTKWAAQSTPHAATSWTVSLRQNPPTRTLRLVPRWPQHHLCLALSLPTARCKHSNKLWTSQMRTSHVYRLIPTRLQSTLKFWPIKGTSLLKLGSLAHTVGCNLQHPMASQTLDQEEAHAEEVRARRHRHCVRSRRITTILPEYFQQHGRVSIPVSSAKCASPKALRPCHALLSHKGACHRFSTLDHNNNLLTQCIRYGLSTVLKVSRRNLRT